MSRRLTFVAAAALGATLTLAACSSDSGGTQNANQGTSNASGPSTPGSNQPSGGANSGSGSQVPAPPPPPSGGDPVKWADNLCAPISDYTKLIATKTTDLGNNTDQSQMQAKLGQFLDDLASGLGTAVDRLKQVEPSPIKDADAVKTKIIDSYAKSQQVLKEAGAKMRAGDQDAAGQVMQSLGEETSKMVDPFKDNDNAPLRDAMTKAPRCKDIAGG